MHAWVENVAHAGLGLAFTLMIYAFAEKGSREVCTEPLLRCAVHLSDAPAPPRPSLPRPLAHTHSHPIHGYDVAQEVRRASSMPLSPLLSLLSA